MVYSKKYPGLVVGSREYQSARQRSYYERHRDEISRKRKSTRDPAKENLRQSRYYMKHRETIIRRLRGRNKSFRKSVNEYKLSSGCSACGFNELAEALVFHHLDKSTKLHNVSKMGLWPDDLVVKEIEKCVILCENCHRELHAGLRGGIKKNPRKLSEYKNRLFSLRVRRLLGCSRCGHHGDGVAIDFHHVNDDKSKNVAYLCCGSREKLKAEMRKCILLCANCHKRETHKE